MKLTVNHYYDDENGEYIASKYYIDGEECSFEDYEDFIEELNGEDECDGNCDECSLHDQSESKECDCLECTLDRFTEELEEITGGCPGCIRECLEGFCDEIVMHIVVED